MKAVLRYLGAKNRLAPWIIGHFPAHKIYVEPFGGSAAVLLNKDPAETEVYNDVYSRLVNFWRVLRDHEKELLRAVELTPYSQDEYYASFEISENPVEDARRFMVNSMMSYGGGKGKPGFRRGGALRHTSCPQSWRDYPETLRECATALRIRNIEINNTDALAIMKTYDTESTLHYVDPPYPRETRASNTVYHHEYTHNDHIALLEFLVTLKGKVVLSGYDNALYRDVLHDWHRDSRSTLTTGCTSREEVLWMNFVPEQTLFGKGEI